MKKTYKEIKMKFPAQRIKHSGKLNLRIRKKSNN